MMKSSKGQFNIEYIISIVIFVSMSAYIIFLVYDLSPTFADQSQEERLRAKSLEISEMLLGTDGEPNNWNSGNVKVVGLSTNKSYIVNSTKIEELNSMSNSDAYNTIRNGYGLDDEQFNLEIVNASNTEDTILNISGGDPFRRAVNIIRIFPIKNETDDTIYRAKAFLVVWRSSS